MRLTPHRKTLLDIFKASPCAFFSASSLKEQCPTIDIVTIYRTLDTFVDEGLIRNIAIGDKESVYEYALNNHYHAICDGCGTIEHITLDPKDVAGITKLQHIDPGSLKITIRGTCKK